MLAINAVDTHTPDDSGGTVQLMSLHVRPPRQQRTREQWTRILDAGVALLEDGGYDAFTIPALCDRAGVPPRALYARTDSKDALFLAVYEHGIARVLADHEVFGETQHWEGLDDATRIGRAVAALSTIFDRHRLFLRAIVLVSSRHPEVARRGAARRRELCDLFTDVLAPTDARSPHPDPLAARRFAFTLAFSALVVRTAYGEEFGAARDDTALTEALTRYLLEVS